MKETNMEHYRSEIEEILESSDDLPCLIDGELQMCKGDMDCCKCEFRSSTDCRLSFVKWLMSPYKPEPVLTQREKGFVECIMHGWIAADEVGTRMWYEDNPKRDKEPNVWLGKKIVTLNDDYFSFITWEDKEPWAVADLRKLKVGGCDER